MPIVIAGLNGMLRALEGGMAKAWSRRRRGASWEREIRAGDGGEATTRSLFRLGVPGKSFGGASCRTKGRARSPSPGRHLVANSVAIVHLREVGRSQWRDCISTAIRLHSVGSHSVTILHSISRIS